MQSPADGLANRGKLVPVGIASLSCDPLRSRISLRDVVRIIGSMKNRGPGVASCFFGFGYDLRAGVRKCVGRFLLQCLYVRESPSSNLGSSSIKSSLFC